MNSKSSAAATTWGREETAKIAKLISNIDVCMFVTHSDGSLRGRPMSNNGKVEFDGDSWFFSYDDTPKINEIKADPRVELAYVATERGTWVSIEGTAEVVRDDDRKRQLWESSIEQWFDGGPEDDDLVLIKVRADRIHAWAEGEEIVATADGRVEVVEQSE